MRRILSRNHPEVDQGWLCDKGRFAYPHLYAEDRIREPLERVRRRGFAELSWNDALDRAEELLRGAGGHVVTALSGSETLEQAYGLAKLVRQGVGAHSAVLAEATSDALDAFRAPLSAIGHAEHVVVVGDERVADRAPIVELWIKQARAPRSSGHRHRRAQAGRGARAAAVSQRARRSHLVWARRRRRRAPRRAGTPPRLRGQARLRGVPSPCDAQRPGSRGGVGRVR